MKISRLAGSERPGIHESYFAVHLYLCPRVGQFVLRRITVAKHFFYWVEGDNKKESIDSRHFGWIRAKTLLGQAKVIHKTALLDRSIMN